MHLPTKHINITNQWQQHQYEFTMNELSDNNAYLNFAVGSNNVAVRFDDISLTEMDCVQAKIAASPAMNIYPNPAKQKVFVELPTETAYQLRLTDISGKVVKQVETELNENTTTINVNDLPKGMYILAAKNAATQTWQKLIIK